MFLAANLTKGKSIEDITEMKRKYTPGDQVLPKPEVKEKTLRERREEDERLFQGNLGIFGTLGVEISPVFWKTSGEAA